MSDKPKALTKTQLHQKVADKSGLTTKAVAEVLANLEAICLDELKTKGIFSLPNMVKLNAVVKPATEEKQKLNPFTKQMMTVKAKPATKVVKARVLKNLKDAVA